MNSLNASMRAFPLPPSHHVASAHRPSATPPVTRELHIATTPMPTDLAGGARIPAPPAGVSPFTWEMLLVNVVEAQRRSAAAFPALRESVQSVVRELRAATEPWEHVYAVLHGVVTPTPDRVLSWEMEYQMYSSRSTVLVAHMQSWADVERLAEIEAEAHAD